MKIKQIDNKALTPEWAYTKISLNHARKGPVSTAKASLTRSKKVSTAAQKVAITGDYKASFILEKVENIRPVEPFNMSWMMTGSNKEENLNTQYFTALCLMQAWSDKYDSSEGTPDYMEKLIAYKEAQTRAYNALGLNASNKDKPNLSKEEKAVYDSIVGPYAFDYYEIHISFKAPGNTRMVQSRHYRTLRRPNIQGIVDTIWAEAKHVSQKMSMTKLTPGANLEHQTTNYAEFTESSGLKENPVDTSLTGKPKQRASKLSK